MLSLFLRAVWLNHVVECCVAASVQMLSSNSRRKADGDMLPCELHQVSKVFLETRHSYDLWDIVQIIIRHVSSKTAPSAEPS